MEYVNRDGTLVPFLFKFDASEHLQKDESFIRENSVDSKAIIIE